MGLNSIYKIKIFLLKVVTWNIYSFQDPNSYSSLLLIWLHDYNIIILIIILIVIGYFIFLFFSNTFISRNLLHGNLLEIVWTVLPIIILFDIALPSLKILYFMENIQLFIYTVKTVGHQWYWRYEFLIKEKALKFDSYILRTRDLIVDRFRLLDVDNRLVLPTRFSIRNVVTSLDVIHSWAIPSLGVKIDAIPGRLNQVPLCGERSGVFYGQCSEICGMNHRFIPIVVELTCLKNFLDWVNFILDI